MADPQVVRQVLDVITATPIGWIEDEDGKLWPPQHEHGPKGHLYDGGCAICRARDQHIALAALVSAVLDAASNGMASTASESPSNGSCESPGAD